MKKSVVLSLVSLVFSLWSLVVYSQSSVDLGEIVVTSTKYSEDTVNIPSNVTVISSDKIKNSNALTTVDLLRRETGIVVRDWYGNGAKAGVDVRGFGESSASNSLVLVDGRRINAIDLSGVDWTQIPLDRVERVEILRGAGSVLYGDNAVAGVINIITKKGMGKPQFEFANKIGSYQYNKQRGSMSGSYNAFAYYVNASTESTQGYRENNHFKAQNVGGNFSYDIMDDLIVRLNTGYHKADYGLAGGLYDTDIEQQSRRASKYGDDHTTTGDYFFDFGAKKDFGVWGNLDSSISYRQKRDYTAFWTFYGGWGSPVTRSRINTFGFTPKYVVNSDIFGRKNNFVAGIDFYRSDYLSDNYTYSDALSDNTDINKITKGYYFQDTFNLTDRLSVLGGWRYESAKYEFDYADVAATDLMDSNITPSKHTYTSGLSYNYLNKSKVFINHSTSFRFPATEEYSVTWPTHSINMNLKPQFTKHYEAGLKHFFTDDFFCAVTLFRMKMQDELYYDYSSFTNGNYDKTRHEGIELEFDSKPMPKLGFFGGYTYTKAKFQAGNLDHKTVPMVPADKANLGLRYALTERLNTTLTGNYVGQRYFINDQSNNLSRLNGYFTLDTSFAYTFKNITTTFAVNNLTNKQYSEYATCNPTTGRKMYYPSPERNFTLEMEVKF